MTETTLPELSRVLPYADILAAVRGEVEAGGVQEYTEVWRMFHPVLKRLGFRGINSYRHDRYRRQLLRALNQLADEGVLVKFGVRDRGPDGFEVGRSPLFYTPAGLQDAKQRHADKVAGDQRTAERWAVVHAALEAAGCEPLSTRGRPVDLDLEGWEKVAVWACRYVAELEGRR